MKKLFALMVVASLAAIGCDDKKSTPKGTTSPTPAKSDPTPVKPPITSPSLSTSPSPSTAPTPSKPLDKPKPPELPGKDKDGKDKDKDK